MSEFAEPRIRRLVADYLGVSLDVLTPEVSLTDDLAADSLDLVELALALEGEFGIEVPERTIDEVRTYGDLVATAAALTQGRQAREPSLARAPSSSTGPSPPKRSCAPSPAAAFPAGAPRSSATGAASRTPAIPSSPRGRAGASRDS